jgi:hypothetical protein
MLYSVIHPLVSEERSHMKLSAPKYVTWLIAVVLGVAGLLIHYAGLNLGGLDGTLLLAAAFVLLAVANATKGL